MKRFNLIQKRHALHILTIVTVYWIPVAISKLSAGSVSFAGWATKMTSFNQSNYILKNSENSQITLPFKCSASYPIEWVYDQDVRQEGPNSMERIEWTDRKFHLLASQDYLDKMMYHAWFQFTFRKKVVQKEKLICRSVSDHTDNVLVRIQPNETQNEILISMHERGAETEPAQPANHKCKTKFTIHRSSEGDYYWQCQLPDGKIGKIGFYKCPFSAAYCANTFRSSRKEACAEMKDSSPPTKKELEKWSQINYAANSDYNHNETADDEALIMPGVALCYSPKVGKRDEIHHGSVEYSFTKDDTVATKRKLHLSWKEVSPVSRIWMDSLVKENYFSTESFSTVCHVPKYGFSFDPVLIVTKDGDVVEFRNSHQENNTARTWQMNIHHGFLTAGTYEIICMAPIWNTTEWVNLTTTLVVHDPLGPSFTNAIENVNFVEGDRNKTLYCKPDFPGDLQPQYFWSTANAPGVHIAHPDENGSPIIFDKITYELTDGRHLRCTGSNVFGQVATKTYVIHVQKSPSHGGLHLSHESNNGNSSSSHTTVIVFIIIAILLIIAGLGFLYLKFKKLKTQTTALAHVRDSTFRYEEGNANTNFDYSDERPIVG